MSDREAFIRCWLPSAGLWESRNPGLGGWHDLASGIAPQGSPTATPQGSPCTAAALGSTDSLAQHPPGFHLQPLLWMKWHSPPGTSAAICFGCTQSQAQWWGPEFPPCSDSEHRRRNERFGRRGEGATVRWAEPGYLSPCFLKVRNGRPPAGVTMEKCFPISQDLAPI